MATTTLHTRYIWVPVSTPAQTVNPPLDTVVNLGGDVVLDEVYCRFPAGASFLVGWQLQYSSAPIIPWDRADGAVLGDNEPFTFKVDLAVSSPLHLFTSNLDVFPHFVDFRFRVSDRLETPTRVAPLLLPASALNGAI